MALVFIGVLVAPLAWSHPRLGRGEKLLVTLLGLLNTLAAIVVAVFCFFWFLAKLRAMQAGEPVWPL